MKKILLIITTLLITTSGIAQYNIGRYYINGIYDNVIDINKENAIDVNMALIITENMIRIDDIKGDSTHLYLTLDRNVAEHNYVEYETGRKGKFYRWIIDDGFMKLYRRNGVLYFSIYKRDQYDLPKQYTTYRIAGNLRDFIGDGF